MAVAKQVPLMDRLRAFSATVSADAAAILPEVLRRQRERYEPGASPSRGRKRTRDDVESEDAVSSDSDEAIAGTVTIAREPPPVVPSKRKEYVCLEEAMEEAKDVTLFYRRHRNLGLLSAEKRCFLCEYGNPTYDSSPDAGCQPYLRLVKMLQEHYGLVSNMGLAINMFEYYTRSLYQPALIYAERHHIAETDFPIPRMSVDQFRAHIEDMHTLNAVFILGESLRSIDKMVAIVEARAVDKETNKLNLGAIGMYIKLKSVQHKLMLTPTQKLLFNGANGIGFTMDPAKCGSMANMSRVETLLLKEGNAIGGQTASDATLTTGDAHRTNFGDAAGSDDDDEDSELAQLRRDVESEEDTVEGGGPIRQQTLEEEFAMDIDALG